MSLIEIRVDGADITDNCLLGRVEFTAQANGNPGTARVEVSDKANIMGFHVGQTLTLDIDGVRAWTGWVLGVRRAFHASVVPTRGLCEGLLVVPRILVIEGVDLNILFTKRVVWDHANPVVLALKTYAASTSDKAVIEDLGEYLDLADDSIDMTTKVATVGTIGIFQDIRPAPFEQGQYFGDAMTWIAATTGAVYYIDPDRYLVYADVDGVSSPLVFTDNPVGVNDRGYRELEILGDASKMVNDMMVWGMAAGVDYVKFARVQDSTSITAHGRWQGSDVSSLYHQAYVDQRASSFVNGTPQSKRGAKDDRVSVKCAVFNQPVRVAERYTFKSDVFGFSDVIPIRQLRITFPTKTDVRYDILASHEIDLPWSFWESKWPRYTIPGDDPTDDEGGDPQPPSNSVAVGVILDSFTRHIEPVFGLTDGGTQYKPIVDGGLGSGEYLTWSVNAFGNTGLHGVEDGRGIIRAMYGYQWLGAFNGVTQTYGAGVPATINGVATNTNNMLAKFRFGRIRRVYPYAFSEFREGQPYGVGPVENPGGATDWDAYGRPNPDTSAYQPPSVSLDWGVLFMDIKLLWDETLQITDPSQWWTIIEGTVDDSTPWYNDNGAGFMMRYAGNIHARPGMPHVNYRREQEYPPLRYVPGYGLSTYFVAGPDLPGMSYPWRIAASISFPGCRVRFVRNNLPTFDGEPFGVIVDSFTVPSGGFTTGTTGAITIAPDTDYWVRVYRGGSAIYVNIWPSDGVEPAAPFMTIEAYSATGTKQSFTGNPTGSMNLTAEPYEYQTYSFEVDMIACAPAGSGLGGALPGSGALTCEIALPLHDPSAPLPTGREQEYYTYSVSQQVSEFESVTIDGVALAKWTDWKPDDSGLGSNYVYIYGWIDDEGVRHGVLGSATVRVCYYPVVFQESTSSGGVYGEPDYTGKVYRPGFISQFGWSDSLDGFNCTMASGCMALDRHTLGVKTSNPPLLRSYQGDQTGGTSLGDVDTAWGAGYGEDLNVATVTWPVFLSMLNAGRGAIVQGVYANLGSYRCQTSFTGEHAVYVNEQRDNGDLYVGDPICSTWKWIPEATVRAYAEALGGGNVMAGFTKIATF